MPYRIITAQALERSSLSPLELQRHYEARGFKVHFQLRSSEKLPECVQKTCCIT